MKQIEITVKLLESIESAISKLEKLQYKLIRESDITDIYMTNKIDELHEDNIIKILSSCVLLRSLKLENKELRKITYKNKKYDENENVISEEKINLDCTDLEKAYNIFFNLGFKQLLKVKYHVRVYEKDGIELAFQEVENLGTLIEYENEEKFEKKEISEINEIKENMYNEIINTGINISYEKDIKKAKELILKQLKSKK